MKVWDAANGKEVQTWDAGPNDLYAVAWSPDAKHLASAHNGLLRIWDADSGREVITKECGGISVAWSPDGQQFATGGLNPSVQVQIWDARTHQVVRDIRHPTDITSVAWSPDGKRLASAGRTQNIAVWDTASGTRLVTLHGHRGSIFKLAWSPDGTRLASAGPDKTVKIWDPSTEPKPLQMEHANALGMQWCPDGSRLASVGGGRLTIWNASTGQALASLKAQGAGLAWSPDGKYLAAQTGARIITIWDTTRQQAVFSFNTGGDIHACFSHVGGGVPIGWEPNGPRLAVAVVNSLRVHDTSTGKEVLALTSGEGWKSSVNAIKWSPDGNRLASGVYDGVIRVWDNSTPRQLR